MKRKFKKVGGPKRSEAKQSYRHDRELIERDPMKTAHAEMLQGALHYYERYNGRSKVAQVLRAYYDGVDYAALEKKYGWKKYAGRKVVYKYKKRLENWWTKFNSRPIKGARIGLEKGQICVIKGGSRRNILLFFDEYVDDDVWCMWDPSADSWCALPEGAQAVLDEHPDFKGWDHIYLD